MDYPRPIPNIKWIEICQTAAKIIPADPAGGYRYRSSIQPCKSKSSTMGTLANGSVTRS